MARTRAARFWPAVCAVLAFAGMALMARPVEGQAHGGHGTPGAAGILPPGDWSAEQVAFAVDLVRRTEEVLPRRFGDASTLPELGYKNFGIRTGDYEHWGHPDTGNDGHVLDPDFPESLAVRVLPDGTRRVEAAMFVMPIGTTMDTIPEDIRWLPGWHDHDQRLCVDDNLAFTGFASNGACQTGKVLKEPMTHVWIVDNICGHRFAEIDSPGVICGHHGPPGPGGTIPRRPLPAPALPGPGAPGGDGGAGQVEPIRVTPRFAG